MTDIHSFHDYFSILRYKKYVAFGLYEKHWVAKMLLNKVLTCFSNNNFVVIIRHGAHYNSQCLL